MPFDIGNGEDEVIRVTEPERESFSENLSGAIQYALANTLYKVMEILGVGLGHFVANIGITLLDKLEPQLVTIISPMLADLDIPPDTPGFLREMLATAQDPPDAAWASVLGSMSSSAMGGGISEIANIAFAPIVYSYRAKAQNALATPALAELAFVRGDISEFEYEGILRYQGYKPNVTKTIRWESQRKIDFASWLRQYFTGQVDKGTLFERAREYGVSQDNVELFIHASVPPLAVSDLFTLFWRSEDWSLDLDQMLTDRGYPANMIKQLRTVFERIPPTNDLILFSVREAYQDRLAADWELDSEFPTEFAKEMRKHGYDTEWSRKYWRSHWRLPSVTQAFEMFHRFRPEKPETAGLEIDLDQFLKIADFPTHWRDRLKAISYNLPTRVDVRRLYMFGIVDRPFIEQYFQDLGYSPGDADLLADLSEAMKSEQLGEDDFTNTQSVKSAVVNSYVNGEIPRDEAESQLISLGVTLEQADLNIALAENEQATKTAKAYREEYQKDVEKIVERSFKEGALSSEQAIEILGTIGLPQEAATYKVASMGFWRDMDFVSDALDIIGDLYMDKAIDRGEAIQRIQTIGVTGTTQKQLLTRWDLKRDVPRRTATEAQYRKAYTTNVIVRSEYEAALVRLGYSPGDVVMLAEMAAKTAGE